MPKTENNPKALPQVGDEVNLSTSRPWDTAHQQKATSHDKPSSLGDSQGHSGEEPYKIQCVPRSREDGIRTREISVIARARDGSGVPPRRDHMGASSCPGAGVQPDNVPSHAPIRVIKCYRNAPPTHTHRSEKVLQHSSLLSTRTGFLLKYCTLVPYDLITGQAR